MNTQEAISKIETLVKIVTPYIYITTSEESRVIQKIGASFSKTGRQILLWSCHTGFTNEHGQSIDEKTKNPAAALTYIANFMAPASSIGTLFIMKDFHYHITPMIARQMKDYYSYLQAEIIQSSPKSHPGAKSVIFLAPYLAYVGNGIQRGLEPTLEKQIEVVEFPLPSKSEIKESITSFLDSNLALIQEAKNKGQESCISACKLEYTPDQIDIFSKSLQGLCSTEIERSILESITTYLELNNVFLMQRKKDIVRRSDILEVVDNIPSATDIGGLDAVKEFLQIYSNQFSEDAASFGIEPLRGFIITGIPGCLSGQTIIPYNRGSRVGMRYMTLEKLYKRFNQLHKNWDIEIPTYFYSFDQEDKLVQNRVIGITNAGLKKVITIKTNAGREITLTVNHPVCIPTGEFVSAGTLEPGQQILTQGTMKPIKGEGKKPRKYSERKIIETLKFYPYGSQHIVNGYTYQRVNYSRLVIEAHMNGISPEDLITILKTDKDKASSLKFLDPSYDIHHIDENPLHDELSNLMILEHSEHPKEHDILENFHVDYLSVDTINSIIHHEEMEMTYDVQMDYPYNNLVANEFIVHNTGKSLIAKTVGSIWNLPVLRLDVGKVMAGIVGQSEERMRQAIQTAQAAAPVILFCDEIEKSLSGTGSSNVSDGGTMSRVFGTLLTAMEESLKNVIIVATANDISILPPELIRRFDEVFFADLPTEEEREDIFKIHLRKRGRNLELDWKALVEVTASFTGSEIEKVVKEGIARAWQAKKREVETTDLVMAAKNTRPISTVMSEKIQSLRDWAKDRARMASNKSTPRKVSSGRPSSDLSNNLQNILKRNTEN